MNTVFPKVAILGAGSWGMALAMACHRAGSQVFLWDRRPCVVDSLKNKQVHPTRLPGISLSPQIHAITQLGEAIKQADFAIVAVPAQSLRSFLQGYQGVLEKIPLVLASKGIEAETGLFMHEILNQICPQSPFAVISGPNLAKEVAAGLPTAVVVAPSDPAIGDLVVRGVGSPSFRPYISQDYIGVQVAGALKNVIAIASGILKGKNLGENACATLITRGLAEIIRFGVMMGANPATFSGLAGVGDLWLTCSSLQSRNTRFGMDVATGLSLDELQKEGAPLAEGVFTAFSVLKRCEGKGVRLPIIEAVAHILSRRWTVDAALHALHSHPFGREENE